MSFNHKTINNKLARFYGIEFTKLVINNVNKLPMNFSKVVRIQEQSYTSEP